MFEKFFLAVIFTLSLYLFLQTSQTSAKTKLLGKQAPVSSPTIISHFFVKNNLNFTN